MKRLLTFAAFLLIIAVAAPVASASHVTGTAVGAQTPSPVNQGSSATYLVTVTYSSTSACTTLPLTLGGTLPTGATAAFSPTTATNNGTGTGTSTLTISTTGSTPAGTTTGLSVTATSDTGAGGCSSTGAATSTTFSLVVQATTATSGQGTMVVSPTTTTAGSTTNTETFTFTGPTGTFASGSQTSITVPTGWTGPTATNTTAAGGTCTAVTIASFVGQVITVNMTCPSGGTFTVTYGIVGHTVTAPTTVQTSTFTTATKQGAAGTLTNIATSPTVAVTAGPASKIAFTTQPGGGTGGVAWSQQPIVTLEDANGNTVTGTAQTVTLAIQNNAGPGVLSGTLSAAVNTGTGLATFGGLSINVAANGYTLTATGSTVDSSAGTIISNPFNITVGPASQLIITGSASQTAGTTNSLTITARDAGGNTATTYTGSKSLTFSGANSSPAPVTAPTVTNSTGTAVNFGTATAITFASGVATVSGANNGVMTLFDVQTATVSATDGTISSSGAGNLSVVVSAGNLNKFAFALASPQNNGVAFTGTNTLTAQDTWGNTATTFNASTNAVTISVNAPLTGTVSGLGSGANNILNQAGSFTSGVANLTGAMKYTGNAATGTFTATSSTSMTGTSGSVQIKAGTATQIAITTQPGGGTGGTAWAQQPIVTLEDANGNTVTGTTQNVTLAIQTNAGPGGVLSGTTTVAVATGTGLATFSGLSINLPGTGYTLTATGSTVDTTPGTIVSNPFNIAVGAAAKLAFTPSPSNSTGGVAFPTQPVITLQDAGGNTVTGSAQNVTLAIQTNGGPGGVLSGTLTQAVNTSTGQATFSGLSINKAGNGYTLTATGNSVDTLAGTIISSAFNITVGTATQIAFTTSPNNSTGGVAFATQPVVTLQDAGGNAVTGTAQTVTLAIQNNAGAGGAGVLSGTTSVAVNTGTGIATFSGLSINLSGTGYTLTASGTTVDTTPGTIISGAFNITVGPANKLGFTVQPGGGTGGVAWSQQPVVALQDAGGNTVTGVAQTVTASIQTNAGPGGTLAGTTAVTLNTGTGLATFTNLSINKIGTGYTLTVKGSTVDTTAGTIISSPFNITAGTATQMVFGQQPSTTQAAATMSPAVTVLLEDAGGNLTTSTASVTVAFGTNTVGGTLSGTLTQAASAGTASFGDLSVNKTATNYTLTAASTGLTTITSNAFTITAGTATQIVFTTQPGNGTGGSNFATQPTVSVEDANNNVVTTGANSTASITLAIGTNAGPGGTLTCTTNPRSAVAGVDTFAGCKIDVAGNGYTLTAAAAGLTGATSNPFNITVGTATKLQIGVQPSNTQDTVAINPAVTVQILDAGGNLTTSTASVTFAIGTNAGPGGVLTGGGATPAVAGTATFSNLSINKIGTGYTLTATSGGLTSATTNPFNITIGPATKLGFSVQPVSTNNHTTITPSVVVQVQDAGGNLVSTATDSITVAIGTNPSAGTLSGTLTQPTSGGTSTFNDLSIDNVGTNYTLTASDGGTFTAATSATFNITAGPASQLIFTTEPSATAVPGGAFTIQPIVTVEDPFNNVVTGSTASITLAIGFNAGPGGVLTCTTNPKAAAAGVDAFAGCKINLVGNDYTLTASASGLTGATSTPINVTLGNAKQVTDQASSSCSTASGTTCTITLNLSGVTSSNNVLLVGISNPSTTAVSTVKWGGASGAALTQVPGCAATETNTSSAHFEIWSITNPNLNPTPDTVVITFGSAQTIYAGAALFSNVASLGTCVTSTGTAGTGSVTLAVSQAGGAGFDTASITSFNSGSGSITTPAGQTNLWALNGTAPAAGAGSYAPATGTSLTMTETFNYAIAFRQAFAYGAVPLNPVKTSGRRGQVIVGSLFPEEKPQPDIFHLGDSSRFQSTSPSSTTNPPSPSTDRDANPSAIISKRDE